MAACGTRGSNRFFSLSQKQYHASSAARYAWVAHPATRTHGCRRAPLWCGGDSHELVGGGMGWGGGAHGRARTCMHTHWRVDRNLESGQDAHLSSINALSPLALVLLPLFLPQLLFLQPINLLATLLTHSLLPSRQVKRTCPAVSCPWRRQDRTCSASTPMPAASCRSAFYSLLSFSGSSACSFLLACIRRASALVHYYIFQTRQGST